MALSVGTQAANTAMRLTMELLCSAAAVLAHLFLHRSLLGASVHQARDT